MTTRKLLVVLLAPIVGWDLSGARWNLFNGGGPYPGGSEDGIDVQDITAVVTGVRDTPPMFGGGTRAFDGPECPWPP